MPRSEGGSVWLRFFRIKLLPTALANGTTGAIAAGALTTPPPIVDAGLLSATIALLYLVGMGANDWFDRRRDAELAPERPIPSGDLSAPTALTAILLALAAALVCTAFLPSRSWPWVTAVLGAILLYDGLLKDHPWFGPLAMGSVRSFVVLLGASLIGDPLPGLVPAVILGGHGFWVTRYSLEEEGARPRILEARSRSVIAHTGAAVMISVLFIPTAWLWHLGWLLPIGVWVAIGRGRAQHPPGWFTFRALRMLLLLDGSLQLSYNSPISAGICVLLYVGTGLSPRRAQRLHSEGSSTP